MQRAVSGRAARLVSGRQLSPGSSLPACSRTSSRAARLFIARGVGGSADAAGGDGGGDAAAGAPAPPPLSTPPPPLPAGIEPALAPFASQIAGRRFLCTLCGKCCTGDGNVWVSEAPEAARIAEHLGLPLPKFYELYCQQYSRVPGWRLLKNDPNSKEAQHCIFLAPDNSCRIHAVRPLQCSTYPWWPELTDVSQWEIEKREICEGFDHPDAPEMDAPALAAAAEQLRAATVHDLQRKLATPPPKKGKGKGPPLQWPWPPQVP
ncbi:hypothetical protein Rsub_13165 [Raphidocelis subcapitata]|uniref:Zinc/iron-chelating domain-containing protein n=1 Tax=Raphidocelis subcapitata TaxID=307507 RepID=A0A2V0PKY0_9CHLO|nr:hypothetical protein Rsub_13165 [Raphidocelis subcapitata]|eukprot:GBG00422.1 hypothetical protein Rsub_13165 [Raphidocelis subcapitata]